MDYVFASPNIGHLLIVCGYGMLYNHSADANVAYYASGESEVTFITTRDVEAGDELTLDYGHDWWTSRSQALFKG